MRNDKKSEWILYAIILQALLGVLGSLYMSSYGDPVLNGMTGNIFPTDSGLLPCTLCWFGRILFYPLLPIALVGFIKNDTSVTDYLLPLSIPGLLLTAYHYGTQKFGWGFVEGCSTAVPCDEIQIEYFGFITIPLLAFFGFLVVTGLALWHRSIQKKA